VTDAGLAVAVAALTNWTQREGYLVRELRFPSFPAAMRFMTMAAPAIERLGHHPEWTNSYDRVVIRLTTHDAGTVVTMRDVELARLLDRILAQERALNPPGLRSDS
jgi:4a-hydroxytetrahydrobiopterin dehydratase